MKLLNPYLHFNGQCAHSEASKARYRIVLEA